MPRVPFRESTPTSDKSDPPQSATSLNPNMLAYQPPYLPLPSGVDFGSDPRPSFTDPNRYGNVARSRGSLPPSGSHPGQSLPPVSHLLSPVSPSGADVPHFPPRYGSGSPTESSMSFIPRTLEPYTTPQYASTNRDLMPRGNHGAQYSRTYRPQDTDPAGGYSSAVGHSQQAWHSLPPAQSAITYPWQKAQRQEYRSAPTSGTIQAQYPRDVPGTTKPLLKVVGERIYPGEGPCYVYEDGSHVKKYIDGEVVNAQWGVTRAGKARRRLAMACVPCREKKVKCEPGDAKCLQCDKSGRDCHYRNARGQSLAYNSRRDHPRSHELQAHSSSSSLTASRENRSDSLPSLASEDYSSDRNLLAGSTSPPFVSGTGKRQRLPEHDDNLHDLGSTKRLHSQPLGE